MNDKDVIKLLAVLKANYQDKMKVDRATIQAWKMVMNDVPYPVAEHAAATWMKEREWPPNGAEIRNLIQSMNSAVPTLNAAWQAVLDRVAATYPGHPAPDWDAHELVKAALGDVGGIREVRMSEKPDDMRKRFTQAYAERLLQELRREPQWQTPLQPSGVLALDRENDR